MRLARMSERRRDQASSRNSEAGKFGESNHLAGFQVWFSRQLTKGEVAISLDDRVDAEAMLLIDWHQRGLYIFLSRSVITLIASYPLPPMSWPVELPRHDRNYPGASRVCPFIQTVIVNAP